MAKETNFVIRMMREKNDIAFEELYHIAEKAWKDSSNVPGSFSPIIERLSDLGFYVEVISKGLDLKHFQVNLNIIDNDLNVNEYELFGDLDDIIHQMRNFMGVFEGHFDELDRTESEHCCPHCLSKNISQEA